MARGIDWEESIEPAVVASSSEALLASYQATHQGYDQGRTVAEHGQDQEDRRLARLLEPALDAIFDDLAILLGIPAEPDASGGRPLTHGRLSGSDPLHAQTLVELYWRIERRWDHLASAPPTLTMLEWTATRAAFLAHLRDALDELEEANDDGGDGDLLVSSDLCEMYLDAKRRARAPSPRRASATAEPKPYRASEHYATGDVVEHSKFGRGEVVAVNGTRIHVAFDGETRALVHRPPAPELMTPVKRVEPREVEAEKTARRVAAAVAAGKVRRVTKQPAGEPDLELERARVLGFAEPSEHRAVSRAVAEAMSSLTDDDRRSLLALYGEGTAPTRKLAAVYRRLLHHFGKALTREAVEPARVSALSIALERRLAQVLSGYFADPSWR